MLVTQLITIHDLFQIWRTKSEVNEFKAFEGVIGFVGTDEDVVGF